MRRASLALALALLAAPLAAQDGPFYRLSWESIASPMVEPPCDPEDEGAWMYALGATQVRHCESGAWVVKVVGAQGPAGPQGPAGADGAPGPPGADGTPVPAKVMWPTYMARAEIPAGWQECDGTNATPDMRGQFPLGTAAGVEAGSTGGSATHGHTYDDVVSHQHDVVVNDPEHAHVEQQNSATTGPLTGWAARDTSTNTTSATGYSTAPAATGITATTSAPAGSVATGTTDPASSLPPHVTVLWICKT